MDDVVKASETGALGAGIEQPEVRANKPPVVKVDGEKTRTVKVGDTVDLAAIVTDDGIPKRRSFGGGGSRGASPARCWCPGSSRITLWRTPAAASGAPARRLPCIRRRAVQRTRRCARCRAGRYRPAHSRRGDGPSDTHHRGQERWPAPVMVRLPRQRRRHLRAIANQAVGRHAGRCELAMGAHLGAAGHAGRRDAFR